jgi:glycosyltransferase involved in cell wall biosynthesis
VFGKFDVQAEAVYNIVDTTQFPFRERRPLKPVLLSNRSLEPHYNVECTLRAFELIQRQVSQARLIVAGDGSERDRLRAVAESLALQSIDFIGEVAPENMPALYEEAGIFVNASVVDNQPLSIIEAFASGLPVVTSGAGGIVYMVGDLKTGLIFRKGDHEAMADRALTLLNDQEMASRIATRAREECNKYTWAAVRNQWLEIYRELAPANDALRTEAVQHAESSGRV